jgi:hypothetical protein
VIRLAIALGAAVGGEWACSPAPPSVAGADAANAADTTAAFDDPCLHGPAGPPQLALGQGQLDYAPLDEGQTVQVERGPQGGYHIWLAARMTNLRQSGSRTTIDAANAADGIAVPTYDVIFTFDPDGGGFCKLYGLRFRVDAGGVDYRALLGGAIDLRMRVTDTAGGSASASKRVVLSADVI